MLFFAFVRNQICGSNSCRTVSAGTEGEKRLQGQVGLDEELDGHIAAQGVFDHLEALAFALQTAAQALRGVAVGFDRWHFFSPAAPQQAAPAQSGRSIR